EGQVVENLLKASVLTVFKARVSPELVRGGVAAFDEGLVAQVGADIASAQVAELVSAVPALRDPVNAVPDDESPAAIAAAVEFVLEGLHLSKRLNKDASGARSSYRGRG